MSRGFDEGIFELRVFVVMFAFNFVNGLFSVFAPFIPMYLHRIDYSAMEISVFHVFLGGLRYVISPVLFFVVLYLICGGNIFNRIASVLISLILGSLFGFWIGGLSGLPLLADLIDDNLADVMLTSVTKLPYVTLGQMLFGFAVLAFFDINKQWINALPKEKLRSRRPLGVVLLSVLYLVFGLFNICALPVLLIHPLLLELYIKKFALFTMLALFFGLNSMGQVLIAIGLYRGRKWGWIPAFISAATSVLITLTFLLRFVMEAFMHETGLVIFGLFLALILGLTIVFFLLNVNVRKYFGLVNPTCLKNKETTQNAPGVNYC